MLNSETGLRTFLGIDLGWYGKPTGLASLIWEDGQLRMGTIARLQAADDIIDWLECAAQGSNAVAAIDAPTVIGNATGIRPAEAGLNRDFRRFHAGCHAANLGRPFARKVLAFSSRLQMAGFQHGSDMPARGNGRFQIEVHPHAASVSLFQLPLIVKYKRGLRADRATGLRRLRRLMQTRFPGLTPPFTPRLPAVPATGSLKPAEDQIDAVMCAYIAAHWWYWGSERNTVYGDPDTGYIVVPSISLRNESS